MKICGLMYIIRIYGSKTLYVYNNNINIYIMNYPSILYIVNILCIFENSTLYI